MKPVRLDIRSKAKIEMKFTLSGMKMLVIEVHPRKAWLSMYVTVFGMVTEVMESQ